MGLLLRAADLDPDKEADQETGTLALNRLQALGLLECDATAATLHRLLAAYAQTITGDPAADRAWVVDAATIACRMVNRAGYPLRGRPLLPHLRLLADASTDATTAQADLCNALGYLLKAQGDLAGARPYYERALAIREAVLGPEHPDTATSLNNLGMLLQDLGDLAGARPYLERALAID